MVSGMYDAAMKPAEDDEQVIATNASVIERFFGSMLWKDTKATSRRFVLSMVLLIPAVILGLHMGLFPYAGVFFLRFVLFFDKIVALSATAHSLYCVWHRRVIENQLIVIGVTTDNHSRHVQFDPWRFPRNRW